MPSRSQCPVFKAGVASNRVKSLSLAEESHLEAMLSYLKKCEVCFAIAGCRGGSLEYKSALSGGFSGRLHRF